MSEEGQGNDPRGAYPPPPPPGTFPDQQPPPQPQAAYPPQPPQAAYPPQPQAANPPQQPTAAAPAQQPKKKRGLIIGVVVAVLLLCAIGGCVSLMGLGLFMADGDDDTIAQAETHYGAAASALETATAALDKAGRGAGSEGALADAERAVRQGRDEIAAAKATISQLDESQGRTDYIASLDAATESLDALQDMLAYLDSASGMAAKMTEGGAAAGTAMDELNSAIAAGNRNDYSTMKTKASAAQSGFTKAAVLFRDAHKIDPTAGLDKAAAYAEKRRKQAELVIRMADSGRTKRLTAYNRDIDSMEAFSREAETIGEPAIVKDPSWADKRMADVGDRISAAAEKSDELHAKALEALGYSD